MKSSFELAMEKFGGAAKKLNNKQKMKIAEIDSKYKAKIAEEELGSSQKITASSDIEEKEKIKQRMILELASLREKCENEKEKIRNQEQ